MVGSVGVARKADEEDEGADKNEQRRGGALEECLVRVGLV